MLIDDSFYTFNSTVSLSFILKLKICYDVIHSSPVAITLQVLKKCKCYLYAKDVVPVSSVDGALIFWTI